MKITPALEYEKIRQDAESWNKVILHREGKFYRAYEWSAWIIKTVVCTEAFQKERGDAKILTCNRYKNKNGEYVLLGFPVESFSKYVPVYKDVKKMEEGDDLMIEIEMPFTGEETYDQLQADFDTWKQSCPEIEPKPSSQKHGQSATTQGRTGVFGIVQQILGYPVEKKSPNDNTEFIMRLKDQAAELL